MIKFKLK